MRKLISSGPLAVMGALLLGSALACAPPPVDKGGGTSSGGTTGGGTGGAGPAGSGGTPSGTGGMASGSGGATGTGGTPAGGTGGMKGTGGAGPAGTGGAKPDAGGTPDTAPAAPTFTEVYDMILKPGCTPCHDMVHKMIIFKDKAMAYSSIKMVVTPGNVATSKFFGFVEGATKKMPPTTGGNPKPPLTADQVAKIKAWVMGGATDN